MSRRERHNHSLQPHLHVALRVPHEHRILVDPQCVRIQQDPA